MAQYQDLFGFDRFAQAQNIARQWDRQREEDAMRREQMMQQQEAQRYQNALLQQQAETQGQTQNALRFMVEQSPYLEGDIAPRDYNSGLSEIRAQAVQRFPQADPNVAMKFGQRMEPTKPETQKNQWAPIETAEGVFLYNQATGERGKRVGGPKPSSGGLTINGLPVKPTPGQTAVDKAFAKEYVDFTATGGYTDVVKGLDQLRGAIATLESGANVSGPLLGMLPDTAANYINPKQIATRDAVAEVVQRNLRLILGAQFTQKEGDNLIARAYNEKQSEEENKKRLTRLAKQIEDAAKQKQSASDYYEQNGTLTGWQGKLPKFSDFDPAKPDGITEPLPAPPDPKQHAGRIITGSDGTRLKSNGQKWERLP